MVLTVFNQQLWYMTVSILVTHYRDIQFNWKTGNVNYFMKEPSWSVKNYHLWREKNLYFWY